MVEVGDKVFVTPVNGQKDYIAVITGPGGAGAVLNEGNYNTWTLEWYKILQDPVLSSDLPDGLKEDRYDFFIDDKNDTIHMNWEDLNVKYRYGIFSCTDFSNLIVSPGTWSVTDPSQHGNPTVKESYFMGTCDVYGGFSHSIQTYVVFVAYDAAHGYAKNYLTVYQNVSSLWNHSVWNDLPSPQNTHANIEFFGISTTGKYILVTTSYSTYRNILLYKGSYV